MRSCRRYHVVRTSVFRSVRVCNCTYLGALADRCGMLVAQCTNCTRPASASRLPLVLVLGTTSAPTYSLAIMKITFSQFCNGVTSCFRSRSVCSFLYLSNLLLSYFSSPLQLLLELPLTSQLFYTHVSMWMRLMKGAS